MKRRSKIKIKGEEKYFFRFTVNQRFQHIILASCVIVLVLTGMPLKFHDTFWAPYLYALFGGIKLAPIFHRIAGTILMILFAYHIGYLLHNFYFREIIPLIKRKELTVKNLVMRIINQPLIPNLKDLTDIIALLKYLMFISNERPQGAEFNWKEKFDYWAPFWGILIIGSSGIMMWSQDISTMFIPGEALNFAIIAHSDEALLATLFLFIWHWYNVHFSTSVFPMGTAFLTGYLTEDLMVEEHYDYYVQLMKEEGLEDEIRPPHGSPDSPLPELIEEGASQ